MANMVGVWIRKISLLLLSLSLLSDGEDSALTEKGLENIMNEMFNRFNQRELRKQIKDKNNANMATGQQYSISLQLSRKDGDKGQLGSNIPTDFQALRNIVAKEEVYTSDYVVAAIPQHIYVNNVKVGTDHSEYGVLVQLQKLTIHPGYLIVYTYFSPCFAKCLKSDHKANIIDLLNSLRKKNQNTYISLVFSSLFHHDMNTNTKEDIYNELKQIPVPVYCCYRDRGSVTCASFDKNKDKNQHCLSEKIETNENAVQ